MSLPTMSEISRNESPDNLAVFCREVRNLLRSKPNCMIPFSKFVPAYHNHYGRQCCVYQFGYTKLIELLEAIPHVVQIIGDGTTANRYITLTHREQIKRFASDLIKVVKSQPGKRLRLSQFARAYQQVLARTFRVEDYGTNNINVLLAEIWEGTINIIPIRRELVNGTEMRDSGNDDSDGYDRDDDIASSSGWSASSSREAKHNSNTSSSSNNNNNHTETDSSHLRPSDTPTTPIKGPLFVNVPLPKNPALELLVAQNELVNKPYITEHYPDCWFEIPKRERSEREIKRTKYFVFDCIELLSKLDRSNYSVPFSKFIPAYHYYFNRQCKVSVFGFSKLIDLFESISPDVVEIVEQEPGEEKLIRLAKKHWPQRPIDCGPTEEELLELERELEDYEQMQNKRSTRMAAIF
uniref:Limkain-b1 n=1 Tax=Aceria tosichella TaxID=561515 RepID=A0A6G1S6X4_9ACAR